MSPPILIPSNTMHLELLRQLGEPRAGPTYRGQALSCDKGSNLLVSVEHGGAQRLRWWTLQDMASAARITIPLPRGVAVVVPPGGQVVLSVTVGGELQEWAASNGALLRSAKFEMSVADMTLSSQGDTLLIADNQGRLLLWDVGHWKPVRELETVSARIHGCALSEDGTVAAAGTSVEQPDGSFQARVMLWNTQTARRYAVIPCEAFYIWDVSFSPATHLLAAGTSLDTILLIDVERAEIVQTLKGPTSGAYRLDFSPDGALLAVATPNGAFSVVNVSNGAELYAYSDIDDMHASTALFTSDGRSIAWAEGSGQVGIWAVNR